MEARIVGGQQQETKTLINPQELTPETYKIYCVLYLSEHIYNLIKDKTDVKYARVKRIVDATESVLLDNLHTQTNKVLLINKIYSLFLEYENIQLPKEYLNELVCYIASMNPSYRG